MINSAQNIELMPKQFSLNVKSTDFLCISDRDYKDFFLALPAVASTPCRMQNGEFEQKDQYLDFLFKGQQYQLCLKQGQSELDDGRTVKMPLPNSVDNEIKNIILNSFSADLKAGRQYDIETERISQLLTIVKNSSVKTGKEYTVDQIINCLVKLNHVQIYVKKQHQKHWYSLSWVVNLDFGIIDDRFYESLNE